ncbi:MAG: lexA [Oscillospiraceae bacterium]|nr:lexA [Oscillospiraceae bacterium]
MLHETAKRIYDYIKLRSVDDIPPTVREICSDLKIKSTSTVHKYLNQLCENGLIEKLDGQNRTIKLPHKNSASVPILGTVTAGVPITAIESIDGYISYSGYHGDPDDLFALRVRGDSMIKAGILDQDIVIIRKQSHADNDDIVVALIDDEATVKRFYKEAGHFRLQPENDDFEPIIINDVSLLGKVIASIRIYE